MKSSLKFKSLAFLLVMTLLIALAIPIPIYAGAVTTPAPAQSNEPATPATGATGDANKSETDATEGDTSGDEENLQGIRLGTGNAVNDILNDDRFAGAIDSISFITKFIDHYFTMIITITAFLIISAAMLKNVFAGAYCSNQKFWNKVAEAHEKADAISLSQIGQSFSKIGNLSAGGFKDAILCLVPNIKAWTDFDDVEAEPKQYFMKSIPQMLACIVIGIFIYNGYYRDTAATVGSFGSEICNRVFSSVDAAKWVDKITLTNGTPPNIYKDDPTKQGQYCHDISIALYKSCVSASDTFTTSTQKTNLMRNCEFFAYNLVNNATIKDAVLTPCADKGCEYEYDISNVKVTLVPKAPVQGFLTQDGTLPKDGDGNYYITYYATRASANITFNTDNEDTIICMTAAFKKVSKKTPVEQFMTKIQAAAGTNGTLGTLNTAKVAVAMDSSATLRISDYEKTGMDTIKQAIMDANPGVEISNVTTRAGGGRVSGTLSNSDQRIEKEYDVLLKDNTRKTCLVLFIRVIE